MEYALAAFPDVNFWYVIWPKEKLSGIVPIFFTNSKEFIEIGKKDAFEAVKLKTDGKKKLQVILDELNNF